jgi:hypothetical protein
LILEGQRQARLHLKSNDPWSHEWGPVHLLDTPIEYREGGRVKVATHREIALRKVVDNAVSGDLGAAALVLRIVGRAERYSGSSVDHILVKNWLPDYADQTANQKAADVAAGRARPPAERPPVFEE